MIKYLYITITLLYIGVVPQEAHAVQDVASNTSIDADGISTGVSFSADVTLTVPDDSGINTIDNANGAATDSDGTGTITFSGDSDTKGDIGILNSFVLKRLNIGTGDITTTGNIAVTTVNFSGDGSFSIADGKTFTGSIKQSASKSGFSGNVINEGDATINGYVGGPGLNEYKLSSFTINDGTVAAMGNISAPVNFAGDGVLSLADGVAIRYLANLTTSTSDTGTIVCADNTTLASHIGSGGAGPLKLVTISGDADVIATGAINVTTLNFTGDGSLTVGEGVGITSAFITDVTTSNSGEGSIDFVEEQTITGNIGISNNRPLKLITISAMAGPIPQTITVDGSIAATTINFSVDGGLTTANGKTLTGTVTTTAGDGTGTLTSGGAVSATNIGAAGAALAEINFNSGSSTVGNNIFATAVNIAGGATVVKNGVGTISSDLTNNGTLDVSLAASDITADASTGATGALTLAGGTLSLGTQDLNVTGAYTMGATSAMNLTVNNGTTFGRITSPAASAVNGGTVNITVGGYIANGSTFNVVNGTGGAVNTVPTVNSTSSAVTFTGAESGGDLVLTAVRSNPHNTVSSDSNIADSGAVLEQIGAGGATGDMLMVLNILDSMGSNQERADAIETMTPDVSSGVIQGSRGSANQFLGSVRNRLNYARSGMTGIATGDMFQGAGFWTQGLGSHIRQGERNGIEGYDADLFGTSIGADTLMGDHIRLGLAAGYGFTKVDSNALGNPRDNINSWQATVYGSFDSLNLSAAREEGTKARKAVRNQGENFWYVDGMVAFTQNNYDSRREILLEGGSRVAKADHYAQQYSTKIEAGYTFIFDITKALEITPFMSINYNYLYMNEYDENGAGALNLTVDGQGFHQMEQGLGAKFEYPIFFKKMGTFIPAIKTAWMYDYFGDKFETTAAFAGGGASFTTRGAKPAQHAFALGGELTFLNKDNLTLTADYDLVLKDEFISNTYYATARIDF